MRAISVSVRIDPESSVRARGVVRHALSSRNEASPFTLQATNLRRPSGRFPARHWISPNPNYERIYLITSTADGTAGGLLVGAVVASWVSEGRHS